MTVTATETTITETARKAIINNRGTLISRHDQTSNRALVLSNHATLTSSSNNHGTLIKAYPVTQTSNNALNSKGHPLMIIMDP